MIDIMTMMTRFGALVSQRGVQLQSLSDVELVEQFLHNRDVDVFEVLVRRYRDKVFALATSILGRNSCGEAEDAAQEVFITIYRRLETFRGESAFSSWLYSVARNQIAGYRRRPAHRVVSGSEDDVSLLPDTDRTADPLDAASDDDVRARLLELVDGLPDAQRIAVHLFYWQDQRVSDIAALLGLGINTVKSHLYRARISLAQAVQESDFEH